MILKFENTQVFGIENAINGMRNPLSSWEKSDSQTIDGQFVIGEADMILAKKLINGGPVHCKFRRMIHVQTNLTAPRFFWSEYDTYKVGTAANSTSTMHKLLNTINPITIDMFVYDKRDEELIRASVNALEEFRKLYLHFKNKNHPEMLNDLLHRAKTILPEGYLQMRTIDLNYETLANMYYWRKNHRLPEWSHDFVNWVKELPYANELIIGEE